MCGSSAILNGSNILVTEGVEVNKFIIVHIGLIAFTFSLMSSQRTTLSFKKETNGNYK
jgi:hypothetical protein